MTFLSLWVPSYDYLGYSKHNIGHRLLKYIKISVIGYSSKIAVTIFQEIRVGYILHRNHFFQN